MKRDVLSINLMIFVEEFIKGKEENFEKIVDMILYDNTIRQWIKEKLEINDEIMPLLFGKTLYEIASLYGLMIEKKGEEFLVKVVQEANE